MPSHWCRARIPAILEDLEHMAWRGRRVRVAVEHVPLRVIPFDRTTEHGHLAVIEGRSLGPIINHSACPLSRTR